MCKKFEFIKVVNVCSMNGFRYLLIGFIFSMYILFFCKEFIEYVYGINVGYVFGFEY